MRQEPRWPAGISAQEFLLRTLSIDQWKAIGYLLKNERTRTRTLCESSCAEFEQRSTLDE